MKHLKAKHESYKVPADYFEKLEKSILVNSQSLEEGKGFTVPTDYFDSLKENILTENLSKSRNKSRNWWISVASIAASLLLIVGFNFILNSNDQNLNIEDNTISKKVDENIEDSIYQSLYKFYLVDDENKKSSNEYESLDDLEEYYNEKYTSVTR
ncbi:hypothetical protein [Faecalibacter rhinopitheci]|uniref:Uncharacterized protein n=1 Tax=Faecalibacter rhinopitheci TaxID=2779678 RepID=A0A8J7FYK8_9FLAO|nr:hypothetical protein [Faecalibacter rhinopitheci]MBF0598053.1 hypothetical protein [Faecalibacter rhinopitheci]